MNEVSGMKRLKYLRRENTGGSYGVYEMQTELVRLVRSQRWVIRTVAMSGSSSSSTIFFFFLILSMEALSNGGAEVQAEVLQSVPAAASPVRRGRLPGRYHDAALLFRVCFPS